MSTARSGSCEKPIVGTDSPREPSGIRMLPPKCTLTEFQHRGLPIPRSDGPLWLAELLYDIGEPGPTKPGWSASRHRNAGTDPCSTGSVARTATTDSVSAARRCRRRPSSTQSNLNSGAYPPAPSTTTCGFILPLGGAPPAPATAPALPASNQASRLFPTCRTRPRAAAPARPRATVEFYEGAVDSKRSPLACDYRVRPAQLQPEPRRRSRPRPQGARPPGSTSISKSRKA